jgi:hypothetical protein
LVLLKSGDGFDGAAISSLQQEPFWPYTSGELAKDDEHIDSSESDALNLKVKVTNRAFMWRHVRMDPPS